MKDSVLYWLLGHILHGTVGIFFLLMARVFFPVGAICRPASVRLPEHALFNMQQSTPFSSSVPNVIHSFLFYFYFLAMAAFDLNLPLENNDLGFDLNVGLQ